MQLVKRGTGCQGSRVGGRRSDAAVGGCAYAQFDFGLVATAIWRRCGRLPSAKIEPSPFCRVSTSRRREPSGGGWRTDYPCTARSIWMIRLSELTKPPVPLERAREPMHYVVRLTDDALFECPFTMASDVGTSGLSPARPSSCVRLPAQGWIPLGGRLLGDAGVAAMEAELEPSVFRLRSIRSKMFHSPIRSSSQFIVTAVPQIRNIGFWRRSRRCARRPSGVTTAAKRTSAPCAIQTAGSWR